MRMPGVVVRSAVKKPSTRLYPFVKRESYKGTRGSVGVDMKLCNQCTLCMLKCPTGAIKVDKAARTWEIDRLRCILCGVCVSVCVRHATVMRTEWAGPQAGKKTEVFRAEEQKAA